MATNRILRPRNQPAKQSSVVESVGSDPKGKGPRPNPSQALALALGPCSWTKKWTERGKMDGKNERGGWKMGGGTEKELPREIPAQTLNLQSGRIFFWTEKPWRSLEKSPEL